jgi:hypothetical protein
MECDRKSKRRGGRQLSLQPNMHILIVVVRFPFTFALRTRIIENTDWMRLKAIGFLRGHITKPMIYTVTDADAGCARMDPPARTIFDSGLRKAEYA